MCLGFRQAVCTGFQICELIGDFAFVVCCGGNGTCVFVIELIVSIYLRFSFACCFDQLFQLELNITQGHFLVLIIAFRVLLDDIQYKLRVLQRVGQLNLAAAAGVVPSGVVAGVVVAPFSLFAVAVLPVELPRCPFRFLVLLQPLPLHHTYCRQS